LKISLLIRRTHMYLALFFVPWILVYSLSTLFFNRGIREFSATPEGRPIAFEKESDQIYSRTFGEETSPDEMARQILKDLGLSGTHRANRRPDGTIVINRRDAMTPRRITFDAETGSLTVERQVMSFPTWLRTIHHRTGFQSEELVEDTWALSVDLAILAMIFWVLSGLWMYWEIKAARKWGLVCGVAGAGLFLFLLLVL
jgi:hypothetical protein